MYKIAIVNSSSFGRKFPDHMERLKSIGPTERITVRGNMHGMELAERLKGFQVIISSVTPFFDEEFFDNTEGLILISRHGIGYNNIDVAAAKKKNVYVTIVPPLVERDAVAENAVANLLAVMRMIPQSNQAAKENRWEERASFVGNSITGKTVGVIGCGNIGSRVAEILKYGFNTNVLICDPKVNVKWMKQNDMKLVDLDTLVGRADIISLNASLDKTSFHILSNSEFAKMKKGIYITNTARGDLLDEEAVIKALDLGIIAGMAVDVMHEEPAKNTHPYFSYRNVIITPHTSAYTAECLWGMGDKCVSDVESVANHKRPECLVAE